MTRRFQFLWHLHQPYYGLPERPAVLPWVRLHAIKSYWDMACMLEKYPDVKAVMNFSGSLLKQLREYTDEGKRDTWWDMSLKPADGLTEREVRHITRHFFSINWQHGVRPYRRYSELLEKRGVNRQGIDISNFSTQDLRDLQVWFNLTWFGFSAREQRPLVAELIEKGQGFSQSEKEALLEQQLDVMQHVLPLYRKLHSAGQIELCVTPMYHPILPLLIDTESASRSAPDRARPARFRAPADAVEHIEDARMMARELLGVDVNGMWPAEGSVSPEAVSLFADADIRWIASDEEVLYHSRGSAYHRDRDLNRPWQHQDLKTAIFFRDHEISDQLGFVYSRNEPKSAVDDFLGRINRCGHAEVDGVPTLVSVILDGENPWEHYPQDGKPFLTELYERLSKKEAGVITETPSAYLEAYPEAVGTLEHLHSGSWIMGNYAIWIGHEETNRAWELLATTHKAVTAKFDDPGLDPADVQRAKEALMAAQGSDWFWWYGDDFSSENDADFDRLFRDLLRAAYQFVGLSPPEGLDRPVMKDARPQIHFEPPAALIHPQIDGNSEFFYEWAGAGRYRSSGSHGSMFENTRIIGEIYLGFDLEQLYLRVEFAPEYRGRTSELSLRIYIRGHGGHHRVECQSEGGGNGVLIRTDWDSPTLAESSDPQDHSSSIFAVRDLDRISWRENLELALSFEHLGIEPLDSFSLIVAVQKENLELERHPAEGSLDLVAPDSTFELRNWMV